MPEKEILTGPASKREKVVKPIYKLLTSRSEMWPCDEFLLSWWNVEEKLNYLALIVILSHSDHRVNLDSLAILVCK